MFGSTLSTRARARIWLAYYHALFAIYLTIALAILIFAVPYLLPYYFLREDQMLSIGIVALVVVFALVNTPKKMIFEQKLPLIPPGHELASRFTGLCESINNLCAPRGLSPPKLYLKPVFDPRDKYDTVACTSRNIVDRSFLLLSAPMIACLTPDEQKGIVAHELRHVGSFTGAWKSLSRFAFLVIMFICVVSVINRIDSTWEQYSWRALIISPSRQFRAPLATLAVAFLTSFGCFLGFRGMIRTDEAITDIRSCLDTGNPAALIHSLERIESVVLQGAIGMVGIEGVPLKGAVEPLPKPLPKPPPVKPEASRNNRSWDNTLAALESAASATHPTTADRRRTLERVFGPLPPLDPDAELPFLTLIGRA